MFVSILVRSRVVLSAFCIATSVTAALGQASAYRGVHIYFDTPTGAGGEQLQLITGVGTAPNALGESESNSFRFQDGARGGQLQTRTQSPGVNPDAPWAQARYNLFAPAPGTIATTPNVVGGGVSPVSGWYARSNLSSSPVTQRQTFNPTGSDLFVPAGRLAGGDFAYEIQSVTPLNGSPLASFALAPTSSNGASPESNRTLVTTYATTDLGSPRVLDSLGLFDANQVGGGSLSDRSVFLGYGNHIEAWSFFVSQQGLYEVSLRAYDVNNRFTPSESFSFLVNSVPAPSSIAFGALSIGLVARRRRA